MSAAHPNPISAEAMRALRRDLTLRLSAELSDAALAAQVVDGLDDDAILRLHAAGGEFDRNPLLSYTPPTVSDDRVSSVWVFAFGYRLRPNPPSQSAGADGQIPPMTALEPGPTNEALAHVVAGFAESHEVPVVAQWEVARVLVELDVPSVISVEPDIASDGSITYLSTEGVARKGMQLATEAGVDAGRAGVFGFADHVARCVLVARAVGLDAAVPASIALPSAYDVRSGQTWTRSRLAYVRADLLGRAYLPG